MSLLPADALEFARRAHEGQVRKGDGTPYINHPVEVAALLHEEGFGETVIAAALLHDVIEDCGVTAAELEKRFGSEVAALVATLTADDTIEDYETRKDDHRAAVAWAGPPATAIYAADKLSNLRALNAAYERQGEALGERFNAPLDEKQEHARRDVEMLARVTPRPPFVAELQAELERLRAARRRRGPA